MLTRSSNTPCVILREFSPEGSGVHTDAAEDVRNTYVKELLASARHHDRHRGSGCALL